jgi:hypothetical protein
MNHPLEQTKSLKLWHCILISIGVGTIVGIATVLGQGVLSEQWNWIANSGTIWLIPVFFVSALASTKVQAAAVGVITLLCTVLGYYGYAMIVQNVAHSMFYLSVWFVAAVIGGIIFGMAGFLWRHDRAWMHKFGSALIGGVFITEGLFILVHWQDYSHMLSSGIVKVFVGLLLVLVLERSNKQRGASLLAMLPVIVLGGIGYGILSFITS